MQNKEFRDVTEQAAYFSPRASGKPTGTAIDMESATFSVGCDEIPIDTKVDQAKEAALEVEWRLRSWFVEDVLRHRFADLQHHVTTIIDIAVPNKEQNRAMKRMIGDKFDSTWQEILQLAYPKESPDAVPQTALGS